VAGNPQNLRPIYKSGTSALGLNGGFTVGMAQEYLRHLVPEW